MIRIGICNTLPVVSASMYIVVSIKSYRLPEPNKSSLVLPNLEYLKCAACSEVPHNKLSTLALKENSVLLGPLNIECSVTARELE